MLYPTELRARQALTIHRLAAARARDTYGTFLPVALELERIALQDEYFVTRKLYPNVDFYSA